MNVELPDEFADWVEAKPPLKGRKWVSIEIRTGGIGSAVRVLSRRYFVPKPPPPKLPEVETGAVVSYCGQDGGRRRAIRNPDHTWTVWEEKLGWINDKATDIDLTLTVDSNGFTVELEGL